MSRKTLQERFWSKVDCNGPVPEHLPELGPCHVWLRGMNQDGYGSFYFEGLMHSAHRVAFFLAHGRWPEPCACHHCDNPACVNTRHLFEGTMKDNMRDRDLKGRCGARGSKGEDHGASKLTDNGARHIRERIAAGATQAELSGEFGVHPGTIGKIWRRERWRHV